MSGAAQSDPHPLRELASQLTIPAAICLCIVVSFAGIALVAPWLAPYDEGAILTDDSFVPPAGTCCSAAIFSGATSRRASSTAHG